MRFRACIFLLFLVVGAASGRPVKKKVSEKSFVLLAFKKADSYMAVNQYDSAQVWLNKIYAEVSYNKPSFFSYFLASRQAEVYYYNNLHQLGLQEAIKMERMGKMFKDSLLIADACNFIGLFYINSKHVKEAVGYFKEGLRFASQPPYKKNFTELSKPHHLLGNLSEAYLKLNIVDSAIYFANKSLVSAKEIKSGRGQATAALNLASAWLLLGNINRAHTFYSKAKNFAIKSGDFDVELNCYSGMADCSMSISNKTEAINFLKSGFSLLEKFPHLNDFYATNFLETAMKVYRAYGNNLLLIKTLELKTKIQAATYKRNNIQIQSILAANLENEKRILNLELAEVNSKNSLANIRLYILLLILLLFIIGFIAYRSNALQRLRVANLRSNISQDLHDEVGATLSGITLYSYITKQQIRNSEHTNVDISLDIIKDNATEMATKLNDIVWAVSPTHDNLFAFIQRLKDFALQIAATKNISVDFLADSSLETLKLPMQERKNIYLISKEAINNAVKYSVACKLTISVEKVQKQVRICIADDGKGFDINNVVKGNGLINMASRAKEIKAILEINSSPNGGTSICLCCKIP